MDCPVEGWKVAFYGCRTLDAHLRTSTHRLCQSEVEKARNGAILARFNQLYGGFPFLDFSAEDVYSVIQKIDNGDPSHAVDVTASINALRNKNEKKKQAQRRNNDTHRQKKKEVAATMANNIDDHDNDVDVLFFKSGVSC